jgi:hypothetical protein
MKATVAALLGILAAMQTLAQSASAPALKGGDTWTYKITTEKGTSGWNQTRDEITVSRVTSSSIYYTLQASGSTQPAKELFAGLDWSRARDVNGKETVVNRPLAFPLAVGKTWDVQYAEQHPNKAHKSEQWTHKFTVVALEPVEVPAGKFNAFKVEAEGRWTAELEPTQSIVQGAQSNTDGTSMVTQTQRTREEPVAGRTYKAFWYVPEVKRWVKSVEEYYSSGGVRTERYTAELESFKIAP